MICLKLTRLVAQHSSELTDELVKRLHNCSRSPGLQQVPASELQNRIQEMLGLFHSWLLTNGEHNVVQEHYRRLGRHHDTRHVSVSDLCWALIVIKQYLCDFVGQHAFHTAPVDLQAELEFRRLVNVFFDGLICYFAEGYERVRTEMIKSQLHAGASAKRTGMART